MSNTPASLSRLNELLVDQSVFGLNNAETAELQRLQIAFPHVDPLELDRLVLGLEVSSGEESRLKIPDDLARRILQQAKTSPNQKSNPTITLAGGDASKSPRSGPPLSNHASLPIPNSNFTGWIAAAACLLLAALGWLRPVKLDSIPVRTPSVAREALIQASRETIVCAWQPQKDPASEAARGDVVWNESKQEGYMRFQNLAANNPEKEQYQLWIFDDSQDAATPIDGGVFDIPPGEGDVIVPIRAKLRVKKAAMFAITIEKPGGVVVSKRERLPLIAQVAAK